MQYMATSCNPSPACLADHAPLISLKQSKSSLMVKHPWRHTATPRVGHDASAQLWLWYGWSRNSIVTDGSLWGVGGGGGGSGAAASPD